MAVGEFKYGDICQVREPVINFTKKESVIIPAAARVTIVSTSQNMAIVTYQGQSHATRIDNLQKI